ncbi:hypothetical protein [Hyphococcus sp.]|uniref:hypothetical protein n=1 Tax=Hyphococcus sp. TaxID=2038636 RepID=UPI00207F90D3|nr:MAG: hypothetical protein DHS20C04_03540 [Marinicaulis sp.]
MEIDIGFWAAIGFIFAAYAVVGNDALQTLGPFINSNRNIPWQILFAFTATVLLIVFFYGYFQNGGDPSFGRLDNVNKYPIFEPKWYHALPPLALFVLTRFGIPVSTTFMVLSIFATMGGMYSMLTKSLMGYVVAFIAGGVIYAALAPTLERWFIKTHDQQHAIGWVIVQWTMTAYLWAVWLMQDFANIYVYLPRGLDASGGPALNLSEAVLSMSVILVLLGFTFWNKGGPIQRILQSKTSVDDIRSAAVINFVYATLLFYFKELNNIPMSTTWVFLGLIAGREFAIATIDKVRSTQATAKIVISDAFKAFIGLLVSVVLAVGLPMLAVALGG